MAEKLAPRVAAGIEQGMRPSNRVYGLLDSDGADRFAPAYTLVVNGVTLTEDITKFITEIDYEDNEEMFDQLVITLSGFIEDPKTGRYMSWPEFINTETLFSDGNIIWVYMGYHNNQRLIGGAEIVRREYDFSDNPSVKVVAYEPLHRMANTFAEQAVTYKGMRSSEIVKKLGRKDAYSGAIGALFNVGLIERLPIFTPRAEVQKYGESDYAFLKRLADVRGWHLFTRYDDKVKKFNLFYGPDVDKQQIFYAYTYNPNDGRISEDCFLSFRPEINTIDQNSEVEIISVDEKRKKKVSHAPKYRSLADAATQADRKMVGGKDTIKESELKNPMNYRFKAFGLNKRIIANRPFKDEGEAKKFIIQWARNNIKNFITGAGEVVGNETLQSRQVHYFEGLGETFSGTVSKPAKWYLTTVRHKISSSGTLTYTTSFDARKVIDWIPNDDIVANVPAQVKTGEARKNAPKYRAITQ